MLHAKDGSIVYRFHARDLHLVLGSMPGNPVRFKVTIDGKPPGNSHGTDVDAEGAGIVSSQRLYNLIRQKGKVADRTFEIRFLDPGVAAYTFTFGYFRLSRLFARPPDSPGFLDYRMPIASDLPMRGAATARGWAVSRDTTAGRTRGSGRPRPARRPPPPRSTCAASRW